MDTPEKNRISAFSFRNVEDSPVFQYINDLSPIESVKGARGDNILHSLAFASPSCLFSSPQPNSYRDSRFAIKRHRSPDLSSPVVLFGQTVNNSPGVLECEEQLKCKSEPLENVSETKPVKEQISLAIEFANSLKNGNDGCDMQMGSCDEVLMEAENETGRVGLIQQSDELCRQVNHPLNLDADSDGVLQKEEIETEIGSGGQEIMFGIACIQNSKQQNPKITDPRSNSFGSEPQQFSLFCNNSMNIEDSGASCSLQVAAGAPDITLSSSNAAGIDSTAKAEAKEEPAGLQHSRKQRSVRRRCLTFDVGGPHKRIPLRDCTNDLPLGFTSINKAFSPQECLDSSTQDSDEILPVPRTMGLHLNGLVNTSISSDRNKLIFKDGRFVSQGSSTFRQNTKEEFSTPVSTKSDWVSYNNKIMEKAPERSVEVECFDKDMPRENRKLSQGFDEAGNCKRCRCRKSKCLKLYCDCFAAGLYCVEPCSCQECFNKPIHEELVLETRRQIEARNPLAFAPKVVSTSDSATDFGEENSKTPASARHMRGCNCKKSGCLKRYCECFMMGVGCSSSCRCLGCKNIHGLKNVESDAVTVNEEASQDNGDHADASSQIEETSNVLERRNLMLLPSSVAFPSLTSL